MKRTFKAYNPLKRDFFNQLILISSLWFVSFFLLVLFEFFRIFPYFALPYLSFVSIMTSHWGNKARISLNGLSGEGSALKLVKNIPREYKIFSNVTIRYDGRHSETDLIVVGPKGVFIIEVKNHIGSITGRESEHNWIQFKTTQFGGKYVNPFFNPTKQVKTHVYRLSQTLKDVGYENWIQGVVYFVNPNVEINIHSHKIPVLAPDDSFEDFLKSYEPKIYPSTKDLLLIEKTIKQQMKDEYKWMKQNKYNHNNQKES